MQKMKEQFIIDKNGKRQAAILPIETYEEMLEDLHDLAIVAERKGEPAIPFSEVKKRLKKDGLI